MTPRLHAPVVTDIDREWALTQCPKWASRASMTDPEEVPAADASGRKTLNWDWFVAIQIERFEAFFAHERKTSGDWSRLWRRSWWPKAENSTSVRKAKPHVPHPTFKPGDPLFDAALQVATPIERKLFERFSFAQFKPDDPRLVTILKLATRERAA